MFSALKIAATSYSCYLMIYSSFLVIIVNIVLSVVCCSVAKLYLTIYNPMNREQAPLTSTVSWSLLKFMSVMPPNYFILCCPHFLLPSIFPSIRVFPNESPLRIRRQKYWSFSFNISPSNEYSGLISFRIVWFDLLAVQGLLKSLLQHHSLKASILLCAAFFMVQLSCPYILEKP